MVTNMKKIASVLEANPSTIKKFNKYFPFFQRISKKEIKLSQSLRTIKKNYIKYKEIVEKTPRRYKNGKNYQEEVERKLINIFGYASNNQD